MSQQILNFFSDRCPLRLWRHFPTDTARSLGGDGSGSEVVSYVSLSFYRVVFGPLHRETHLHALSYTARTNTHTITQSLRNHLPLRIALVRSHSQHAHTHLITHKCTNKLSYMQHLWQAAFKQMERRVSMLEAELNHLKALLRSV